MDGRVKEVTRLVKSYDPHLFAKRLGDGTIAIYRRNLNNSATPYHFIFALTDNWTMNGKPREWGLEVIRTRLVAMDLWKNETVVDRIEKEREQDEQACERTFKNDVESFLKEFRRQFARSTDGINTSALSKVDTRRRVGA
jgi:hypothetical protein